MPISPDRLLICGMTQPLTKELKWIRRQRSEKRRRKLKKLRQRGVDTRMLAYASHAQQLSGKE